MAGGKRPLRLLISAGPTREPIDPVRFISNYSTGYMGAQLAVEALVRGHRVTMVCGPSPEPPPRGARVIAVETAQDMERALQQYARGADAIIMAAAVADFHPTRLMSTKLPRRASVTLRLKVTPDIIARLPHRAHQVLVGFALETGQVLLRAKRKLRKKRLDVVLAQRINRTASPFGRQKVDAWLLERGGATQRLGHVSKTQVARVLLDKIEGLWYGQRSQEGRR